MSKSIRLVTAVFLEAGLGLVFCRAASAGTVWDDAFGWYRGGFDFNGNGIVEKFDFLDQRHPSTAGTKQHSQLGIPDGAGSGDVCFRTGVDVFSPMMNRTIPGQQCVELPQKVTYDAQGQGTAKLSIFRFPRFIQDDTYSAIIRFEPAEDVVNTGASWLLNFSVNWGAKTGVIVGFKYDTQNTSKFCCQVGGNLAWPESKTWGDDSAGGIIGADLVISNNVWTEMSVVVNGKTLRIGVTQAGSPTQWRDLDLNASWIGGARDPASHSFVPYGDGSVYDTYDRIYLGGYKYDSKTLSVVKNTDVTSEKYPDGYPEVTGEGATPKVFRGLIHEVAFWDRVLTDDEVREAFAAPTPNLARYGIPGLTSTLFLNGATPVSDSVVVNPLTKQDFRDCRYKLASGGKLGVQFNVPERIAGLEQIVFVKAEADSATARLSVRLDGKALQSLSVAADGAAHCSIEKSILTAGDHLLELVREDSGAGAFALDHMTIGGSFQMGAADAGYKEMSTPETAPATTTFAVGNPK
ncbi:MAG: hypothetical protein KBT68_10215, partial [bacterium]|nr:hypothetical protein [Candidatus Colisoma equi]